MHKSHHGFVCSISFLNEKHKRVEKKTLLQTKKVIRYLWKICKYFPSDKYNSYSYLQISNLQTIPIPICTEVSFANLFLVLFAGKITIRWSLLGNLESWKLGNLETWQLGNLATWKLGNLKTWKLGNLETWKHGNLETWKLGNLTSSC